MAKGFRLKRAYEAPAPEDGTRVLVERLWPRGIAKDKAQIDDWQKALSPSPELRRWYSHDVSRWEEFRRRYLEELEGQGEALDTLRAQARRGPVTLVFAARDPEHSSAAILKEVLEGKAG
ncbi:MAG TPA: DUF488 family protein [Alphaproteobacteria bacterium]|nr:DUF488 family protein [Alphaproteobacteria bacterium]